MCYQSVLTFQVRFHAEGYFGTITNKCPDYALSSLTCSTVTMMTVLKTNKITLYGCQVKSLCSKITAKCQPQAGYD